jgi:hypothetical protein
VILGGTIFDMLEEERGSRACEVLVSRLHREGPAANLEAAFDARVREIESGWRDYLREVARPTSA